MNPQRVSDPSTPPPDEPALADCASRAYAQVRRAQVIASMAAQAMDDAHMDVEDCMELIEQFCEQAMTDLTHLQLKLRSGEPAS
jgi:hypothetical protein